MQNEEIGLEFRAALDRISNSQQPTVKSYPMSDVSKHNEEIQRNLRSWDRKPLLKKIYRGFHELIARHLSPDKEGSTVELGSGIGNIKDKKKQQIKSH